MKVAVLPGDGIGPEVTAEAVKVLKAVEAPIEFEFALVGGAAYDDGGHPLPTATLDLCRSADAVLLGAVGGPKWDGLPVHLRPEVGALLPLRGELNLYANVRPAKTMRALAEASPIKSTDVNLVVVRELTGGIYFGKPRERRENGTVAIDTCVYSVSEVERIARVAFQIARTRACRVCSVDKANVLETSRLWRETVTRLAETEGADLEVSHMLVDNCAMQLVRNPGQFDVILTENLFGDVLSDEASMITGSLGLLASASLSDPREGRTFGLYEPIHGSAPDIAGKGIANPIATVLSAAMMLRTTFSDDARAARIERAVERALDDGLRTADLGNPSIGTTQMGDAIVARL